MAKTMEIENSPINIITDGTTVKGDIVASGDFRLDGLLEGNIQLNGKLVIGDSGVVNGNVLCQNANIIGTVNGNLSVKELLSLHASARVRGDILINKLSIEPGAVFSGKCRMIDEIRAQHEEQPADAPATE
ncbi:MAG: polymer-forming cytoskeletal protein [Bacteroidales bacterium]|nr:polymer-forming cytoskeletal protein [Bacteroidales bacterium]